MISIFTNVSVGSQATVFKGNLTVGECRHIKGQITCYNGEMSKKIMGVQKTVPLTLGEPRKDSWG